MPAAVAATADVSCGRSGCGCHRYHCCRCRIKPVCFLMLLPPPPLHQTGLFVHVAATAADAAASDTIVFPLLSLRRKFCGVAACARRPLPRE
eukprot:359139-Chlamydomonas_euryale.AAC.13